VSSPADLNPREWWTVFADQGVRKRQEGVGQRVESERSSRSGAARVCNVRSQFGIPVPAKSKYQNINIFRPRIKDEKIGDRGTRALYLPFVSSFPISFVLSLSLSLDTIQERR